MKLIKLKPKAFGVYQFKAFMFSNFHGMLVRLDIEQGILHREVKRHEIN